VIIQIILIILFGLFTKFADSNLPGGMYVSETDGFDVYAIF